MLGPPIQMGVKRKYIDLEVEETCYLDQRQSVLNISMFKLKPPTGRRVEPSLRRSVLIFNTLRHIEHELESEGVKVSPASSLLPSIEAEDVTLDSLPTTDRLANQLDSSSVNNDRLANQMDSSVVISGVLNRDNSLTDLSSSHCGHESMDTCPSVVFAHSRACNTSNTESSSTTVAPSTQHRDTTTTISTSVSSSVQNNDVFTMINFMSLYENTNYNTNTVPTPPTSASSYTATSGTTGTTSVQKYEDLLSDIDLSLYDFDMFSPLSPSVKLTPLSAEDLIHSLPPGGAFTDNISSSCKNELLSDDLDHIMQILVGM